MKKIFILSSLIAVTLATTSFAEPTELDKKTVASKAYVDTKQDIIQTGLVTFSEPEENIDYTVPALVSYGTGTNNADGVLGNKIGILGLNLNGGLGSWEFLNLDDDSESAYLDNFVPTVRAVASELGVIRNEMTALTWNSAETTSTNAYDITFVDTVGATANAWPSADRTKLINTAALAKGLALKQNKIAQSGKRYAADGTLASYNENSSAVSTSWLNVSVKGTGLVTKTATNGVVGERKIFEASDVSNYHAANLNQNQQDIQDISIPTVGAMMTAITNSITAAAPSGTPNTLANYDSTGALGSGIAVASVASYNSTTGALENGSAIPNITALETKQNKMTCAGWDSDTHTDEHCWLWSIAE